MISNYPPGYNHADYEREHGLDEQPEDRTEEQIDAFREREGEQHDSERTS